MATGTRPDGEIFASGANEGEVLDFPSVPRGWGVTVDGKDPDGTTVTDATNGIPPMEWFNALQKRTDGAILWMLQNAWPDWAKGTWPKGATVVNGGTVWRAQKETAVEPDATAGDWLALFPLANLDERYLHTDNERVSNALQKGENLYDVADAAQSLTNLGGVPTTRKVNKHALSDDITLTASDVNAFPAEGGTVGSKGITTPGFHVTSSGLPASAQGMYLGWNEQGGQGEGDIIINPGTGGGGLRIRGVNSDNSQNVWTITIGGDGSLTAGGYLKAAGLVYGGDGACWMSTDGNIYGSLWGGYLSNWVNGQLGAVMNARVASIGLGARVLISNLHSTPDWSAQIPIGAVLIAPLTYGDDRITHAYYSYLMYNINGNWVNAGQVG